MMLDGSPAGLLAALYRRKLVFALVFALIVGAGVAYVLLATPIYRSDATLVVRFGDKVLPEMARGAMPVQIQQNDRREIVLSHVAILTSRDLLARVLSELGPATLYPAIAAEPADDRRRQEDALRRFAEDLAVEPDQQGNVIRMSYLHPDPAVAERVVRHIIDDYMRQEAAVYSDPELAFQRQQVQQADATLQRAQAALADYKAATRITAFDEEMTQLVKQHSLAQDALREAQARQAETAHRLTELEKLLASVPAVLDSPSSNEKYRSVDDAQQRLADLKQKEQTLLSTYTAGAPVLQQLRASIAAAQADVGRRQSDLSGRAVSAPNLVHQTIQTDYLRAVADAKSAEEPVRVLQAGVAGIEARMGALEAARSGFNDRTRAVALAEDAYKALATHLEDSQLTNSRNSENISRTAVIAQPSLPGKPARPRVLITLGAAVVAGLGLALAAALAAEAMDDRFGSPRQLALGLGLPVLASFERRT